MSKEIMDKVEEINRNLSEFQKSNKQEIEQSIKGHVDPLLKAVNDRLNDAISQSEAAKEAAEKAEALAKTRHQVEDMLETSYAKLSPEKQLIRKATVKYWAGGNDSLEANEKQLLVEHSKAMGSFTGADGGYAVMPEIDKAIVQIVRETSPVRQYAEVLSIGTDRLVEPYEGDDFSSGWVGEEETRDETNTGTLNEIAWDVHEQYAMPAISQKLLDDAYFDIENYVINKIASLMSRTENTAFVSGDGVKKPRGFLTYASGTSFNQIEQVVSGHASTVTADGLIDLVEALKAPYLSGAVFFLKRSTVKAIRKLIDGNGNYLWGMGLNGGTSPDLLGYPIVRADDMPALQASALSLAFGNFREAYRIVDRIGTRILRDPYTKKGYVRLYTTKRVGGAAKAFEALKIQVIST